MDAHDTHCCIEHGCKYCDEDCPIVNGVRKQVYLCEDCVDDGVYGDTFLLTEDEQQEYIDALWEEKQNSKKLEPEEEAVAEIARKHGRARIIAILSRLESIGISVQSGLEILKRLKGIK